jgi:thiamine biosynthesis lipoprotein
MKKLLPILLAVMMTAPGLAFASTTRAQMLMGTTCEITVPDSDARYIDEAFAEAARVEKMISTWRPDSELSQLNAGTLKSVSGELRGVLMGTIDWAKTTGGTFNPLVRPFIDAWKTRDGGAIPTKEQIEDAKKRAALTNVDMSKSGTLTIRNGAQFEEGAWGKGYAIERMLGAFRRHGTPNVVINFGGQIGRYGTQPYVTIADPEKRDTPVLGILLGQESISTSSGSEKAFHVGGRTFTHIIDPRTGQALPPRGSVSVLYKSAFAADVLSTALYVMGPEEGVKWARAHEVQAIFITDKNEILTSMPMPSLQVLDAKFTLKK